MAAEVCVLLAEHEPEVAEMSARYLRRNGLAVRLVTEPGAALAELARGPHAAAVLDLTMPGLDPRRIRRALRTPVVFLDGGPRAPRPRGLSVSGGPRRWLGRPFGPRQLVELVREVLEQQQGQQQQGQQQQGQVPGLTAAESAVLAAMTDRAGRVLSRRELLEAAGHGKAGDRAADVYIAQLRAKIGPGCAIRTVRGAGYVIDP